MQGVKGVPECSCHTANYELIIIEYKKHASSLKQIWCYDWYHEADLHISRCPLDQCISDRTCYRAMVQACCAVMKCSVCGMFQSSCIVALQLQ